jgi:NAD(P)-dependent dehydrogenase (short-subunit alcohol dehydrogenase family)
VGNESSPSIGIGGKRGTIMVTGGSRGIGEAVARHFARDGHPTAILDINEMRGRQLASELSQNTGATVRFYPCDVADEQAVFDVTDQVAHELGDIEIAVTAAALIPNTESIMDMDMVAHDRMWRVNYHGTVHVARSVGRQMVARGQGGAIVTLGSINSLHPLPLPAYNPGKAAIARFTALLAAELGRHNIRANCVAPTYVMTAELQARIDAGKRDLKKMMETHALNYLPGPSDIADAVAFLCSPQARAITGIVLPVDSGWTGSVSYITYAGGVPWAEGH